MGLGRYIKRVWRWWWLILLSTIIAGGVSFLVSSQQPRIYQTSTVLRVGRDVTQNINPNFSDLDVSNQLARSYAQVAHQEPVLQATIDSLALPITWNSLQGQINAYAVEGTQLLIITVRDTSPERAAAIADEIARQLILQSPTSPENKAREERSQFVKNQLDDLQVRIDAAKARIQELHVELDKALSARQISELQTEITNLEALINSWQSNYTNLLSFLEGGDSPNYLVIVEPAALATVPISPNIPMNVILAAAVGFTLVLGVALLIEYIDDTIRSPEDVSTLSGVPILGSINRMKGVDYQDRLTTTHSPFSPIVEAYRLLRTNVLFTGDGDSQPDKSIVITSPNPGEGKSLTAANLGVMMAQTELKTIIVDADLRRPAMHKIFQLSNSEGLTDLFSSPELGIENYLKSTGLENLWVLTSGPLPSNPAELLGSQRMAELLKRLAKLADLIILDSSPILAVTDAVVLANQVDSVILVVEAGRTRRKAVKQALEMLHKVGANVLGSVLNRVSGRNWNYAYYAAYTRSGHESIAQSDQVAQRRWWKRLPVLK